MPRLRLRYRAKVGELQRASGLEERETAAARGFRLEPLRGAWQPGAHGADVEAEHSGDRDERERLRVVVTREPASRVHADATGLAHVLPSLRDDRGKERAQPGREGGIPVLGGPSRLPPSRIRRALRRADENCRDHECPAE